MTRFRNGTLGLALVFVGSASPVLAGMPSPELVFTELGRRRWEELSFFLVGFLAMAGVVRWLWNVLRRDLPALPELSYGRSVTLLVLWGLLMTVVLALISGARELMTPGAWEPKGVTYKLARELPQKPVAPVVDEARDQQRRLRLENLRFALWQFAASHEGHFPSASEVDEIASELWLVEGTSPLRFVYVPGQSLRQSDGILVFEPEVFDDSQYVILTNGAIGRLSDVNRPSMPLPTEAATATEPPVSAVAPANADHAAGSNGGR
ncbi:MAG: hypothetical protein H7062_00935 [Candidatus Saccharimonas sp.]|nr:hypothetical protein [Planctomycetaceae bacterium]